MKTYRIPDVNFPRLKAEIDKLNKRALKLGCEPIKLHVLRTIKVKHKDPVCHFEYEAVYNECTVEGQTPMLSGWTLVAVLEPHGDEMLVREVPGQMCPVEYRKTDLRCDHCGFARRRNAVYLLKNEDSHKQVGSNCLKDFLGGISPDVLLASAEYLMDITEMLDESEKEDWGCGGSGERFIDLEHFVSVASIVIRRLGWVSRTKAMENQDFGGPAATADIAWDICCRPNDRYVKELVELKNIHAEPSDIELAHAAIRWGKELDADKVDSSYLHDLGVCCRSNHVVAKTRGFVASVIGAYQRDVAGKLEHERKEAGGTSKCFGEKDKRYTIKNLKVALLKPYISGPYNKTFVKFTDGDNNVFVWRASGSPDWLAINKVVTVKATVKEHGEFNGEPQTILERVKVETEPMEVSQ